MNNKVRKIYLRVRETLRDIDSKIANLKGDYLARAEIFRDDNKISLDAMQRELEERDSYNSKEIHEQLEISGSMVELYLFRLSDFVDRELKNQGGY